jgi:hypothetical protein
LRTLIFKTKAADELEQVTIWLESKRSGLGHRFSAAVQRAIDIIKEHPQAFVEYYGSQRRAPVRGFPFALIYVFTSGQVSVLAVIDLRRDPATIRARLDED